jgi:hypothetical protein
MPRVRLTGLMLFITAIVLGLAAAITQTSHLEFKRPDAASVESENLAIGEGEVSPLQFASIPIIYPLVGVGLLGLALWFIPGGVSSALSSGSERRGSRRTSRRR